MKSWTRFIPLVAVTIIFLVALSINISPFLRGPGPYYPDWRWDYEPTNTLAKLYAPFLCFLGIGFLAFHTEKKDIKKSSGWFLFWIIIFGFLLQLTLLFYSRSGINVLVSRIIDPNINGYFTTALHFYSLSDFFKSFNLQLNGYPMYARFHPPFAELPFILILNFFHAFFSHVSAFNHIKPAHSDVAQIWNKLADYQKAAAVFSGIFIAFVANFAVIPLYYCSKLLYGKKAAMRSAFLFLFIPSMLLFTPLNDTFLPLLTCTFLFVFVYGLYRQRPPILLIAGLLFCASIYFSLTFLPLIGFLIIFSLVYAIQQQISLKRISYLWMFFFAGILIIPFLLFFVFGFNSIETAQLIMKYHLEDQEARHYGVWVFYNVYDFFLFFGIPLTVLFLTMLSTNMKVFIKTKFAYLKNVDVVFLAFVLTFLIIDLEGSVRGETARIWMPYMPILLISLANYITEKLAFTKWQFIGLLLLQAVQVIVFQSVLVTVY